MKDIHLHRSAGLRIQDSRTKARLYLNALEQVAQDAEINLTWPEPGILRIFPLEDRRIAVVRETAAGLSQEAASPAVQTLYQTVVDKADLLIQKEVSRRALEASMEASSTDEV